MHSPKKKHYIYAKNLVQSIGSILLDLLHKTKFCITQGIFHTFMGHYYYDYFKNLKYTYDNLFLGNY